MFRKIAAKDVLGGSYSRTSLGSANLGDVFWLPPQNDAIGWRAYRLVQCLQTGGMSIRELMARSADLTGTVTAAAGQTNSTRQLYDTDEFAEDPTHVGDLLIITDDAGAAGAAPEGEFAIISFMDESGDDFVRFDSDFALSAAPAASDTYRIKRMWRGRDAATSDAGAVAYTQYNILGVLPAAFTVNYFGYVQCFGICQVVNVSTTAVAVNQAVLPATVGVTGATDGTSFNAENIGIALDAWGTDAARATIHIDVLFGLRGEDAVYNRE